MEPELRNRRDFTWGRHGILTSSDEVVGGTSRVLQVLNIIELAFLRPGQRGRRNEGRINLHKIVCGSLKIFPPSGSGYILLKLAAISRASSKC